MADENNITTLAKRLRPFIKLAAQEMVPVTPYDHSDLVGLASDDHLQYIHNTTGRTITAVHTFSPSTTTAPFILGANGQGQTVTGLKADQLAKAVTAGNGLTGGGNLTDNISLAVGAGAGLTVNADDVALTTPGTLDYKSVNSSSGNHTHVITNSSNPGAGYSLLSTDANGAIALITLKTDTLKDRGGGSLLINPAGDISLDPTGNEVLPVTNYEINLGSINKKYLTLHAAELWVETLVAADTIATIGGRILVAPTTILTRDLSAAATSFYVKHNQIASGDRVYLENNGNVEWMAITSAGTLQPEGDYLYSVTRNLDGSGANSWYAGDAVLNTGTTGDGYIDIYSEHSIRSGTQYGPTIVGNIRTGTTYSNLIEGWAVGNLNGLYGYGADTYGAAFGKYVNSSSYLTIDPTNGIQMMWKNALGANLTVAQWDIDGTLTIGQVGSGQDNIYIASGAINLRVNTTNYINMTTAGVITVGLGTGPNSYITSTGIQLRNSSTVYVDMTSAGVITVGATSGGNVYISASGIAIRDATTTYINLDTSGNACFGRTGGTYANVLWNATNSRLEFRTNTTVKSYIDTDGALVIKTGTGYGRVNAITFNDGTNDVVDLSCYSNAGSHFVRLYTYALSGHTADILVQANTNSAYPSQVTISATNSVGGDQAYVECRADSTKSIIELNADDVHVYDGDFHYYYDLHNHRTGTDFIGRVFVPLINKLTATDWTSVSKSTTTKTLYDLQKATGSGGFGAPSGIKAVLIRASLRDSASATSDCFFTMGPVSTSGWGITVRCSGLANDSWTNACLVVPCDANGDIYWECQASGSLTLDITLEIWGYWI